MKDFLGGKIPHYLAVAAFAYALVNGGWSIFDSLKSGERKLKEEISISEYVNYEIQKAIDERMPTNTGYVVGPVSQPVKKTNGSNP